MREYIILGRLGEKYLGPEVIMGLKEQIVKAVDAAQVEALLAEGATYILASRRTRSAWVSAAERRLASLGKSTEAAKLAKRVEAVEERPAKKDRKNKHGKK